jgi:hypothetical protein
LPFVDTATAGNVAAAPCIIARRLSRGCFFDDDMDTSVVVNEADAGFVRNALIEATGPIVRLREVP